jgi:hypothetical protein
MARKWSNLNLPGALHYVTGNCINRFPVFTEPACCKAFLAELKILNQDYYWSSFRSFYSQRDETLAVDHNWWWPDDSEKLSKAMKELGWYTYWKRKGET